MIKEHTYTRPKSYNIYDYLQVNSNFFFAEKFEMCIPKKPYIINLSLKKLDMEQLQLLLEDTVFGKYDNVLELTTIHGTFLFFSITDMDKKETIIEFMKNNSQEYKTYHFSNVDYFSYGRFAIAENGKIVRYLSYNSEAMREEDIVTWIGKPHNYEYATKTFYTKQKLIDCQMTFDSDVVCDMVDYYLPFVREDMEISSLKIYSKNKNIKKYINNFLNQKQTYEEVDKEKSEEAIENLLKAETNYFSTSIILYKNGKVNISNNLICVYELKDFNSKIFASKKRKQINILRTSREEFFNILLEFFYDYKNGEISTLGEYSSYINQDTREEKHIYFQIIGNFNKLQTKTRFFVDTGRTYNTKLEDYENINRKIKYVGTKFSRKVTDRLYREIIKKIKRF